MAINNISTQRQTQLRNNWSQVNNNIFEAIEKSGREAQEVQLVAVSKTQSIQDMAFLYELGAIHFGENRVPELLAKQESDELAQINPVFHMIGTLQRRRVRQLIGKVDLIHSVDSLELAQEISLRSATAAVDTAILLEINISGETSKHGFSEGGFRQSWSQLLALDHLQICGLMTMAPLASPPETSRDVFLRLHDLFAWTEASSGTPVTFSQLSMGMSNDYEIAIECGATMVRVGSALFRRD